MTDNQLHEGLNITTWTGATVAVVGGVTLTEWLAIGGFILALAGFCVNVWHKRKMLELERQKIEMMRVKE